MWCNGCLAEHPESLILNKQCFKGYLLLHNAHQLDLDSLHIDIPSPRDILSECNVAVVKHVTRMILYQQYGQNFGPCEAPRWIMFQHWMALYDALERTRLYFLRHLYNWSLTYNIPMVPLFLAVKSRIFSLVGNLLCWNYSPIQALISIQILLCSINPLHNIPIRYHFLIIQYSNYISLYRIMNLDHCIEPRPWDCAFKSDEPIHFCAQTYRGFIHASRRSLDSIDGAVEIAESSWIFGTSGRLQGEKPKETCWLNQQTT